MKIKKAVITAAGRNQNRLPLQTLVDRDGIQKSGLQIIIDYLERSLARLPARALDLENRCSSDKFAAMKIAEIKGLVKRTPFRPFAVRLNNGAQYRFREPRDIGATKDYHLIIYFGRSEAVRIDTDSIVEIIERQ